MIFLGNSGWEQLGSKYGTLYVAWLKLMPDRKSTMQASKLDIISHLTFRIDTLSSSTPCLNAMMFTDVQWERCLRR